MNSPGRGIEFYQRLQPVRFAMVGQGDVIRPIRTLDGYLQQLESSTTLNALYERDELLLGTNAKTRRGAYRLTSFAFRQASHILLAGMSTLIPVLAGLKQQRDEQRAALIDGLLAVQVWNSLVNLRFPLIASYSAIRNEQTKTIEGFVTSRHRFLNNTMMCSMVMEAVPDNMELYAASVVNRRLAIWVRQRQPQMTTHIDGKAWPVYDGYYFLNGEATGTAVRGTRCLFLNSGICLAPYNRYGARVTHAGKDFMERVCQLLSQVVHVDLPWSQLRKGIDALGTASLGYELMMSPDARRERTKKLVHSLGLLSVQRGIANDIVGTALTVGRSYRSTQAAADVPQATSYASRTLLDLFVPLTAMARRLDTTQREKMEQAAFEILMGRIIL